MNAIDLLIEDHERVKDLLTRLTESTERAVKTRTELLSKLEMEVTIHTQLEEQILYPAYKEAGGKEDRDVSSGRGGGWTRGGVSSRRWGGPCRL
mgnify:CR=1 FL=1